MAEKFKTYQEFKDDHERYAKASDSKLYFANLRDIFINEGDPRNMAKGAFIDIYPEMLANGRSSVAKKIYEILYDDYTQTGSELKLDAVWDQRDVEYNFLPSGIEKSSHRRAHVHMLDLIYKAGGFAEHTDSRNDIARTLYEDYRVVDVGGKQNLWFTKRELRERSFTIEDVLDNLPYIMVYFEKMGYELTPFPDGYGDTENQQAILKKMKTDMKSTDSDNNMWTAYRRTGDGEGLEVNIMAGNHGEQSFDAVHRWHYIKEGKAVPLVVDKDLMWKILIQAKSTHFIDAQQDPWETGSALGSERGRDWMRENIGSWATPETLKEKWKEWYEEGGDIVTDKKTGKKTRKYSGPQGAKVWRSIPHALQEVFDPRKFEYDYIIKPLHEKYGQGEGELSDEDFEEMIEMERQKNTWTFEERWLSKIWDKWKEFIEPPGNPNWSSVGHDAYKPSLSGVYNAVMDDE